MSSICLVLYDTGKLMIRGDATLDLGAVGFATKFALRKVLNKNSDRVTVSYRTKPWRGIAVAAPDRAVAVMEQVAQTVVTMLGRHGVEASCEHRTFDLL